MTPYFMKNIHLNKAKVNTIVILQKCIFIAGTMRFSPGGQKNFALFPPAIGMMLDISWMPMLELPGYISIYKENDDG